MNLKCPNCLYDVFIRTMTDLVKIDRGEEIVTDEMINTGFESETTYTCAKCKAIFDEQEMVR